jgi:hypothetical protein
VNHFKAVGCAALVFNLALIGQAADADNTLVKEPLMACLSDKTVIGGVNACGKIWKIGSGEVTLNVEGRTHRQYPGACVERPVCRQV